MNVCVSEFGICRAKLSAGMCLLVRLTMKVRKMGVGAILLLITELMTYYAPVDMQRGAHTQTEKWPSLLRCSHNVADSYGKSLTVRWRANNATHTHKHTRAMAATDKEPHQTGFNEVTSPKEKRGRKEG